MIVCLDTNVVVQAMDGGHRFSRILDAWVAGELTWAVSTEVLLEYQEVIVRLSGTGRWRKLARLLDLVEAGQGNLLRVAPSFQFRAIVSDRDDDKFADCAITAGALWLVTEDRHFDVLRQAGYQTQPIAPDEFIGRFL
jgi:predicted nucleic acid-binding protein